MNEWEKAQKGMLYDANYDKNILKLRDKCADLCFEFNNIKPSDKENQNKLLKDILGQIKGEVTVTQPFYCDYGFNISIGENFYSNHNLTILDAAKVTIGDNVFIGPNCVITTASHPKNKEERRRGLEFAKPIKIGNDVWIGSNVVILPGITIEDGAIIGAGSVVTKDIQKNSVVYGYKGEIKR